MKEPVRIVVGGGTATVQAVMTILVMVFHLNIPAEVQAAITTIAGFALAEWARTHVTPVATLPAGVAAKIASNNAVPQ